MFRLEVIDFVDNSNQAIVARVPEGGTAAIQYGAQLIVQQNQEAVFFRDGRAMDRFGPGRYTLTTANVPIITRILTSPWEKSPFQACVYFVGKHLFADERWGTRQPITLRDKDFGVVRLRGYGKFAFRVIDSELLINTLVGTQGKYSTDEISSYLKDIIVAGLTDLLASSQISLLDLPSRFDELGAAARVKLASEFAKFGLELNQFLISSISPPEEVQKAIDARSGMSVIGDLRSFTVYQAAKGMESIGQAGGGAAGIGVGMMFPGMIASAMNAMGQQPNQTPTIGQTGIDFSQLKALPSENNHRAIVENLIKQSGWSVDSQDQDHMAIVVPLGPTRRQRVNIDFNQKDNDGNSKLSIWSVCGPMNTSNATALLRYNDQLVHGAFALRRQGDSEQVVLRANLLADTTDALELSRSISAIAWQADQVEMQLSGVDAN